MSVSRTTESPLHPAEHLLRRALVISVVAHILFYGCFALGQRYGWWKKELHPFWFHHKPTAAELKKAELAKQVLKPQQQMPELVFVETDPTAVVEAPKDAKYYSSHNSKAANPDATIASDTPKIDGRQTHVIKTQTATVAKISPLQPSPPKATPAETDEAESKPKPKGGPPVGDLTMAKPAPQTGEGQAENDTGQSETPPAHQRARRLADVSHSSALPGEKMKQDGGVQHHAVSSSLNAIGTPFGEYDREIIEAITTQWYSQLESKEFSRDRTGRAVVEFTLHSDGRVSDMRVIESDVGDLLTYVCESAISKPAPFGKWPPDMQRYYNTDTRVVRFAFYYE